MVDRAAGWIIGLAFYLTTSRPPDNSDVDDDHKRARVFNEHGENTFRKATASVIHCVGGDGLGVITAMIVAREPGDNHGLR